MKTIVMFGKIGLALLPIAIGGCVPVPPAYRAPAAIYMNDDKVTVRHYLYSSPEATRDAYTEPNNTARTSDTLNVANKTCGIYGKEAMLVSVNECAAETFIQDDWVVS